MQNLILFGLAQKELKTVTYRSFGKINSSNLGKLTYLSLMQITRKWTQPIHNRGIILNQFLTVFESKVQL